MTGIVGCCARAASGHAAPLPSRLTNSRRLMVRSSFPQSVCRTLNLRLAKGRVLGPVLNRSESSRCGPPVLELNNSTSQRAKSAALRDFDPPHVALGSDSEVVNVSPKRPLPPNEETLVL